MSLEIRPADLGELAQVGELTARAYLADRLVDPGHDYLPDLQDAARRAQEALVLVAVSGQQVVGTITVASPGSFYAEVAEADEWELRMLAVDPVARGRGLGERLLGAGIDHATASGAGSVVLSTMPLMHSARRMYERLGLRRRPDRDWPVAGQVMLVYTTA